MEKELYTINKRKSGTTWFLSVTASRGNIAVTSSEKAIPPIVEYDDDGNVRVLGLADVLEGYQSHPYKPNSPDFSRERLADLEVHELMKYLDHYPTLPTAPEDGSGEQMGPHPVAEYLYSHMVYLRPTEETNDTLRSMGYIQKSRYWPHALASAQDWLLRNKGVRIDMHAVPKRKVGTFAYMADDDGFARPAKTFSFGFHRAIPNDRLARELSSLKAAERFLNQRPLPFELDEAFRPYVTMVRFAIVATEQPMLDGVDLYPSAVPKLACRLVRERAVRDVWTVPQERRRLQYRPFRAGVEVVHREFQTLDESETVPGTIRMVLPGGVKVAAQVQEEGQLVDESGEPIDAMIDYRTLASKGALALFAMLDPANFGRIADIETDPFLTTEEERNAAAWALVEGAYRSLKPTTVRLGDTEYEAYVGELPVMRPGQRYTELSKPSNDISSDLIARAILSEPYVVRPHVEAEYQRCRDLRFALERELHETTA